MNLPIAWSIVIGIFVPILILMITKAWDPVAEYLGYPFDVRPRVKELGDAVNRLLEMKSNLLRLDPHPLSEQRVGWLRRVEDLLGKAAKIENGHKNCGLNYFTWCYFGKEAGKEVNKAKELTGEGKELIEDARATPRPVRDTNVDSPGKDGLWGMESYKEKVLSFVQDSGSTPLGIWGMGGVGKSSLLKLVYDTFAPKQRPDSSAQKQGPDSSAPKLVPDLSSVYGNHVLLFQADAHNFDDRVGQLQKVIATKMGLHQYPNETLAETLIFNHLKDKSFLLLLDDLRFDLDLHAVGIPMPLGIVSGHRRTVIFTTRNLDVCTKMGCRDYNTIRMECLSEKDAWQLFAKLMGDNIEEDTMIHEHAKEALCMDHFEDERHPDIINLQILSELQKLRELAIVESSHMQKVLIAEGGPHYDQWLLPYLETFGLNNLLRLEKVTWKNAGMDIRVVSIYKCDKLKDVTWVQHLKLLEQLTVAHCKQMEILIEAGESSQGVSMNRTATINFPRLKKLKLEEMPKLSIICKQACEFEELSYICVTRCNEMKDIQNQMYKHSMINIDCNEDWWNRNSSGRFIPYFAPTFSS